MKHEAFVKYNYNNNKAKKNFLLLKTKKPNIYARIQVFQVLYMVKIVIKLPSTFSLIKKKVTNMIQKRRETAHYKFIINVMR